MNKKHKKLVIGIDINEILRARWLQFDRFYVEEFGEEGVPQKPYVYDFFDGGYKWKNTVDVVKELREPEDMPEHINPIDYQVNNKTGEADADFVLFKAPQKISLTAKEVYNRFMYEDYLFEIFGSAPMMYKNMDIDIKKFYDKYSNTVDFVIISKENQFSISPTLFFLSKLMCWFKNYRFVETNEEILEGVDYLITTDPELLVNKNVIKLLRPYNESSYTGVITPVFQLNDLTENKEFEKLIKYKK
jgi:hypothetical protein